MLYFVFMSMPGNAAKRDDVVVEIEGYHLFLMLQELLSISRCPLTMAGCGEVG